MIVVIADDLSGAAEIAGIGLRYSLDVEVATIVEPDSSAELLVIATDTRSMKEADAIVEVEKITGDILLLQPELVFKKIDSVLRGHVLTEVTAQLNMLDYTRVLVVPANPLLGRTIIDGTYFLNGQPIHKSSFSVDPEFPVNSSSVLKMLRSTGLPVMVKKNTEALPDHGIIIGEVSEQEDLDKWAEQIDGNTFPAGGSGFFSSIMEKRVIKKSREGETFSEEPGITSLFVCGSTFKKSRDAIQKIKDGGGPVSYMPESILCATEMDDEDYQLWCNEITSFIHARGRSIIAIGPSIAGPGMPADILRKKTAMVVAKIFQQETIHQLLIEGGSTAAAIIRMLELHTFIPVKEFAPGVVKMKVKGKEDLFITVKPGSYDWPIAVWDFE